MYVCSQCNKELNNVAIDKAFSIAYDKCRGKKCPDCGKVRKLGLIKMTIFTAASDQCPRCKKDNITVEFSSSDTQGTCEKCFWEKEEKKGCICIRDRCELGRYYCFLCEDIHASNFRCEECASKKEVKVESGVKLLTLWQVIFPSVIGGMVIGIIIGFVLGKIWRSKKIK